MDSCFGEFITQQYSLLKQILSNLQPCDLRNAKLVCRDWHNAVNALIDRNPKILSCTPDNNNGLSAIPKAVLPDLILHPIVNYKGIPKLKRCTKCGCSFLICPCKVSSYDSVYIAVLANWCLLPDSVESSPCWKSPSLLLLSTSEHIKISTFYLERASDVINKPVTDEVVDQCIGGEEPIKAILIISSLDSATLTKGWFNSLLHHIAARQGLTFAVGGGLAGGLSYKKGVTSKGNQVKMKGVIFITFRGDDIQAQSDVFAADALETTWSSFKKRTGDVPVGGTQIAFIAQAVAIDPNEEEGETQYKHFKKHFPNALQCTFRSMQEFGIRNSITDPEESDDRKRARLNFSSWQTTSLLLLTFKKV